ncbi:uncharacterized protein GGS22DRAFT_174596 [Annulohypoxylon maeteangense]|uniref:uncharacterized protein n=1 Tax=Annulohypoxylon maeteangense TaxID=1927788 RepID=UPI002008328F|nr:uncharacterized protein GGS22DRAFT_174596 [Annulohypoxylon maeteangense]KAI0880519.1 hypothetical protein GGS22DRAFT_174596 [Annulohypoxylon maeteangense]
MPPSAPPIFQDSNCQSSIVCRQPWHTINDPENESLTRSNPSSMCEFSGTRFSCGCLTWKGNEYKYCYRRGKGCKTKTFRLFEWQTFCPGSRKFLKEKTKYDEGVVLPRCCSQLEKSKLESLCLKCNSIPDKENELHRYCAQHMVCVSEIVDPNAEKEFEKFAQLWPGNLRARYLRRKQDLRVRDVGWSL